nr:hypothetical protein [Bacilli bacterium]
MFLSKLALYGTVAGVFFSISAFSTVQITKQLNKTPVPNETEEEEEEESYVRVMSDTEKFIKELTAFGNMEGNLNLTLANANTNVSLVGDVFVSMESMDNIMFDADLDLTVYEKTFDIKATYIDNTVFATIEGNNLKLKTENISDFTTLLPSTGDVNFEFMKLFNNIDPNQLIVNLSAMTSEVGEDKITYTCNLIEGLPPIIFTSDLNYKMTGVSLSNFVTDGFTVNVNATTNILGAGHNRVSNPESETNPYTDVTSYIGVIKQIKSLINNKNADIGYNVSISKLGSNYLSTNGIASIDLSNGLTLNVDGELKNKDNTKSVTYLAGLNSSNIAYLNFNDVMKLTFNMDNFESVKNSITNLMANEEIVKLTSNMDEIVIPAIEMINTKNYNGLLNSYKGVYLSENQIRLSISNSLLDETTTNDINLVVNLNENGITDVNINGVTYGDYSLSLNVTIEEYSHPTIDLTGYDSVNNINKIIDQIDELLTNKKLQLNNINITYGDFTITGFIQLDIENSIYMGDISIQKATTTKDSDNNDVVSYTNYNIKLENDGQYYYITYSDDKNETNPSANDVKVAISEASISNIIDEVKGVINGEDTELKSLIDSLMNVVKEKINLSSNDFDIMDILFDNYLKSFDIVNNIDDTKTINIAIDGNKINLDSDLNLAINLNQISKLVGINGNVTIDSNNAEFNVNLADFDANLHAIALEDRPETINEGNKNAGGWVGASNLSNVINYVTSLDSETQTAVVNQVKDIIENKEAGATYNISVNKGEDLVFNIAGDLDLSLVDLSNLNSLKVNFNGNMTNPNSGKELDSNVAIKLYDGVVYFDYNDDLKLSYSIDDIKDLVDIIKTKINNNSEVDISGVLNSLFPNNDDTASSPIVDIITNKNYISLINYYKNAYVDSNNKLNIVFDGALLGNEGSDIVLTLNANHNGIDNISINNIYALGYTLNCSINLESYTDFTVTSEEANTYTNLKYINNIFDELYELVHKEKFNITLDGTVNLGDGDISISGSSFVSLNNASSNTSYTGNDFGVAELNIVDTKGTTHNVKIDVNRNKVSEDATEEEKKAALTSSDVLFSYNNNLKGSFNLGSLTDTISLMKNLAANGNPLLDKFASLLTKDSTQSTFNKIMNGEPEAILYDNTLKGINYGSNTDGFHYYQIIINGDLLKGDNEDTASDINIYINMDANNTFTGVRIDASFNGIAIDITIGINEAIDNTISWNRLTKNSSYFDFSDIDTLLEYLFETATKKDFVMSGTISANVIDIFSVADISMNAKVHINEETNETIGL